MPGKKRLRAAIIAAAVVLGGLAVQGAVQANSGTTNDPDEAANTGIDIMAVSHDDAGDQITYALDTFVAFANSDVFKFTWNLDTLDGDATPGPNPNGITNESGEACIEVGQGGGGVLVASLKPDCGSVTELTANVTHAAGTNHMSFSFPMSGFRQFTGLSTKTTYDYNVTSADLSGNSDTAPDSGLITHASVPPTATPTPTPTASPTPTPTPTPFGTQTSSDTQAISATIQGVLTIDAVQLTVPFGTLSNTGSATGNQAVGQIDYTNTLNHGINWDVSVAATNMSSATTTTPISSSNMQFTPGGTITGDTGSTGTVTPAPNAPVTFSAAVGSGYSAPVSLATAPAATQGAFHQTGSALKLTVPLATQPGAYNGTLQYTITG